MDSLLMDLRYALRGLAKSPAFTAIAALTLAVGTGANATIFSFVDSLLLRRAPGIADPSSLVAIYTSDFSSGPYGDSSYPDYLSLKSDASAFSELAAYQDDAIAVLRIGDGAERARVCVVSGEYFSMLGVRPALGRLLTGRDTPANAPPAAVISHALWQRGLGNDRGVLGRTMTVAGRAYTVVGVAPADFTGLELGRAFDVWTPMVERAADPADRGNRGLSIVGRLGERSTLTQAQAQLSTIAAALARAYPATNLGTLAQPGQPRPMVARRHARLHPAFRGEATMIGAVLMGAVALVLVIACANVAGLLVSRSAARAREIAVRLALGATWLRIVREALTESALLGLAGGTLGVLCAMWTADALPSFFPPDQARLLDARVDWRVTAFTLVVSLAGSLLFGAASAVQALNPTPGAALRGDAARAGDTRRGARGRRALVVVQVAIAFVLLASAGLLVRSLGNALRVDLGFGARDVVLASVELPANELTEAQGETYYRDVVERVRWLRGVEAAGLVRTLPLGGGPRRGFRMEGYEPRPGEDTELPINVVDPGYFEALRIPVVAGRAFTERDRPGSAPVAVVNDVLARRYFDGRAIGRTLRDSGGTHLEIVGVVRSGTNRSLRQPPAPMVYYALAQSHSPRMTLVARTSGDPAAHADTIRREMREVHRGVAVYRLTTLDGQVAEALAGDRLTVALVTTCGVMALLLAAVGLYGVIAYAVIRRMREIGVRVALGARPRDVTRLVLGEGLVVTGIGIACGAAAALGVTRLLESMLFGVSATDGPTFAAVPALLAVVALVAAWIPARRALRLDPIAVLRQE
jgi:predicted permease